MSVLTVMETLTEIRQEIDRLSARRVDVMRALSEGFDATLKAEHLELEEQIARLWDEQRQQMVGFSALQPARSRDTSKR